MGHALVEQRFGLYEDVKKWLYAMQQKGKILLSWYSQIALKMGKMYNKLTLYKALFIILSNLTFFKEKNPHFILAHLVFYSDVPRSEIFTQL